MLALDLNSAAFDFPPVRGRSLDYFIASSPHSGIKLLSEALRSVGSSGAPHDYFGRERMASFAKRWDVGTVDSYVRALRRHRTTKGGVFGFTAHYHQFEDQIGADLMADHFADARPILFLRRDRQAQAAEWAKATVLDRTSSGAENESEHPRYDTTLVDDLADQIAFEERGWRTYFSETGVLPHVVYYEDLMRNLSAVVRKVLSFLGLTAPDVIDETSVQAVHEEPTDLWTWRSRRARGATGTSGRRAADRSPRPAPARLDSKATAFPLQHLKCLAGVDRKPRAKKVPTLSLVSS